MSIGTLTAEEAIALLPEGPKVHTFLGFIGADWPRHQLLSAIAAAAWIRRADTLRESAMVAMGHSLVIAHPEPPHKPLYVETTEGSSDHV